VRFEQKEYTKLLLQLFNVASWTLDQSRIFLRWSGLLYVI